MGRQAATGDGKRDAKPRLVIATDNFLPRWDGIARFLAELIPRLLDEYDVTVISPDYGVTDLDLRIRRILIPLVDKEYGDYIPAQWRPKMVRKAIEEADIVFCQTIGPVGYLAHRWARKLGKPLAAFIHSIEWELVPKALNQRLLKRLAYPFTKMFTRFLYRHANLLIVPSRNTAELLTWQRIDTKKVVVNLGVDTKKFVKGDRNAAKRNLKLPKDSMVIGFHGRLGHEKNLLTLSRAFIRLDRKGKRLLIVGDGVYDLKQRLKKVRGALLPGSTDNIVPYLQAMDIYVMPSFTETTSLAVLEAMSCELPIISSPVGFIQQYITHGKNGFFYDTKNAFDLSRKLQLLADNPVLRSRIGAAARKTITERFNWDRTAEGIAVALGTLLPQTKKNAMKKT